MQESSMFKVGEHIYVVERDECGAVADVSGYMFLAQSSFVAIVTCFINDIEDLDETLQYLVDETCENYNCDELAVFPIKDCYATLEEANNAFNKEVATYEDEEEDDE